MSACSKEVSVEAATSPESAVAEIRAEFKAIDLDRFIEQAIQISADQGGKRFITLMQPVRFTAKMKRLPEAKDLTYIYTAMEMAGIQPLPDVRHRMFVESAEGRIIPVYVEAQAVEKLNTELTVEASAEFIAYHAYSYSKGAALLVVDFVPATQKSETD